MTAVAMGMQPIPGLHAPLNVNDLDRACTMNLPSSYNGLPRIHASMSLGQHHISTLVEMFARYDTLGKLGFILLHKHDSIVDGQVKLETKLETVPGGKWIKPASITSLDPNKMHGTVFNFLSEESRLVPYEFGQGPSTHSNIDDNAVKGFIDYITKHDLVDKIALQVLEPVKEGEPTELTAEVELGEENGTVVLPMSRIKNPDFIPTGWSVATQQSGGPEPKETETWQVQVVKGKETHKVFISHAADEKELLEELVYHEVIEA
ncbi:hypothetical protein PG987_004252 [Apiospora arundinis]